jgi:hypothetical protein
MKRILTIFTAVLLTANVFAQSPEKMSYQAVVRNSDDQLVTDKQVGLQISILQGSATGAAVYVETQTPTTNANGLINIEIGGGVGFNTINWSDGPYFLKTESDPTGGANFTITGTSQLLSVPYALHAKTAETVTGTISETDPVYTSSQAVNITTTDITNLGNLSGTNTGDQDLSALALKSNVLELDNTTAFTPDADYEPATKKYVDDKAPTTHYSVGDFALGGIVFWVDETGQNGLVCAKEDQNTGVRWYAGTYGNTQAKGDGPFSGEANSAIIIAAQVAIGDDNVTYAARICNELLFTEGGKTYGDWYLPSKEELDLMYQNIATINATATANGGSAFEDADYWSSNESDSINAWFQFFATGGQYSSFKYVALSVRAIRAF